MRHTTVRMILGFLVFLLWLSPVICLSYDGNAGTPDKVMISFINAMVSKDSNKVLSFFSKKTPYKWVFYEIGTTKPLYVRYISYQDLAKDFKTKTGRYHSFFDDPNGYTYQVNFKRNKMWKKKGKNTFVAPDSDFDTTYIKWKRENGQWVISEMGDSGP